MALQRDQVTVWERHIKNTMLTRLNVSALIWGYFGLARAADDLVHTFAGRRPNLSPWKSYWAMGLCPGTPRKAIYTAVLQMGSIWIGCKAWKRCDIFLWSNFKYLHGICLVSFIIRCKSWPAVLVLDQPRTIFWSPHQTVNFHSFYDFFFFFFSKFAQCLLCLVFLNLKTCQFCLFKHNDTSW